MPEFKEEKRRHTIGPRGLRRVHLFQCFHDFRLSVWLKKKVIHVAGDPGFNWVEDPMHVTWLNRSEEVNEVVSRDRSHLLVALFPDSLRISQLDDSISMSSLPHFFMEERSIAISLF